MKFSTCVIVYMADGSWDCSDPDIVLSVSNSAAPVNRMLIVSGKLWCACLNDVIVLSVPALNVEVYFTPVQSLHRVTDLLPLILDVLAVVGTT